MKLQPHPLVPAAFFVQITQFQAVNYHKGCSTLGVRSMFNISLYNIIIYDQQLGINRKCLDPIFSK